MRRFLLVLACVLAPLIARAIPVADASLCYHARPVGSAPRNPNQSVTDRYASSTADLGAVDRLCAPADYDTHTASDPVTHLIQRRARRASNAPEPPAQRGRRLDTALGTLTVDLLRARWVALPARVDPVAAPPLPTGHAMNAARCWSARVTPGTVPLGRGTTVEIDDPYGLRARYRVGHLDRVCTPANVGGADTIFRPQANLACFRVQPLRGETGPTPPATVRSRDPLASGFVRIGRVSLLCMPAALDAIACNGDPALCARTYDQVAYATTHNAMSNSADGFVGPNQRVTVTQQLHDGVRGLMLDTHYDAGAPYLCHAFCFLGKKPFVDGLLEIRRFLDLHPNEVVSIIFESYIGEADVAASFDAAGLLSRVHAQPLDGAWPTLGGLLDAGHPLVVFTDVRGALPWHHYVWDYASETPYSFATPQDLSCVPNRGNPANGLFILNHFLTQTFGSPTLAEQVNHNPLFVDRALECQTTRQRLPNFVTVDHYDIGDVFAVVRTLNGL